MTEYLDYTLSQFLLFSPEVFYQHFALYHQAIFPAQLFIPVFFCILIYCYRKAPPYFISATFMVISLSCILCAIEYHIKLYNEINWVAHYFAKLFILQSLFLLFIAYQQWGIAPVLQPPIRLYTGLFFLAYSIVTFPIFDTINRGNWLQAQLVGITPDPIMLSTLGVLLCFKIRRAWLLAILPIVWLLVSSLIFYTMGSYEGVVFIATILIFVTSFLFYRSSKNT